MRYSSASVTLATRPVVIAIGRAPYARVPDRLGWRGDVARWWHRRAPHKRVARWWHGVAHTWTARPISTPQMLALQAAGADPITYLTTLAVTLRQVFPWRPRYRLCGDPLRRLLHLPDAVRGRVLSALLTIPEVPEPIDDSPLAELRRQQRAAVYGDGHADGHAPSLAIASLVVRSVYGDAWYYAPDRWPTSDGYAPFALTWVEYVGLQALDARQRLAVADGFAVAHAKDFKRARASLERAASPPDQVH